MLQGQISPWSQIQGGLNLNPIPRQLQFSPELGQVWVNSSGWIQLQKNRKIFHSYNSPGMYPLRTGFCQAKATVDEVSDVQLAHVSSYP